MASVISLTSLGKKYGKHQAVSDVSFEVEPGSVVGLIGPNGAGKTTILRMLVDIIRPTSGAVKVFGHAPRSAPAHLRERIGYLPGELKMSTRASARQVLSFFADVSGPVAPGAMEEWAGRFGLDLGRPVNDLSKGNKQKLGLVQALMHTPDLLILDEPTSGLDPLMQREFLAVIQEVKHAGRTVLLSSHVLGEIQQAADTVVVLSGGKLVAKGPRDTLALSHYKMVRVVIRPQHLDSLLDTLRHSGVNEATSTPLSPVATAVDFRFTLPVNALVRALGPTDLVDLTIADPDLEDAVLGLYDGTHNIGGDTDG